MQTQMEIPQFPLPICGNSLISRNSLKCARGQGTNLSCLRLARSEARNGCLTRMSTQRAQYEAFAWWLTRERIGQDLRQRYPALEELPPRLLALVRKLDVSQSNNSPQEIPSGWISKLDAMEGERLLRACKKPSEGRWPPSQASLKNLTRSGTSRISEGKADITEQPRDFTRHF
jgi:hypothetical protein